MRRDTATKCFVGLIFSILLFQLIPGFSSGHKDATGSHLVWTDRDDPILIDGDGSFNSTNGVSRGSGTQQDPYIIENKTIKAKDPAGIKVVNTTEHLTIMNCTVIGESTLSSTGVALHNSSNVNIISSHFYTIWVGIHCWNSDNITISNTEVNNSRNGVMITNCVDLKINNSHFYNNIDSIYSWQGIDMDIGHNLVTNTSQDGICITSSIRAWIHNNSVEKSGSRGIFIGSSDYVDVEHNDACNNYGDGMEIAGVFEGLLVKANNLSNNGLNGIYSDYLGGSDINFTGNYILNNDQNGFRHFGGNTGIHSNIISGNAYSGIYFYMGCYYNSVINNSISGNGGNGIAMMDFGESNLISDNRIFKNQDGIAIYHSYFNDIFNNEVYENQQTGIYIGDGQGYNNVQWNIVHDNKMYGIKIDTGSQSNLIFNNSIYDDVYGGIYLEGYLQASILNNTISGSPFYGISILNTNVVDILNNYFFCRNSILNIHNTHQTNVWNNYFGGPNVSVIEQNNNNLNWNLDSESKTGTNIAGGPFINGNYWADYNGEDIDGNGIGDTHLPHGPGDEGPLVLTSEIPQLDTIPPSLEDITIEQATTNEWFNASYRVTDDRNIFGLEYDIKLNKYHPGNGWEMGLSPDEMELDEHGILKMRSLISSELTDLQVNIALKDLSGNMANFTFMYEVEDSVHPWIEGTYWEEEALTDEIFTVYFSIWDNIQIGSSQLEYYFDERSDDPGFLDPVSDIIHAALPVFNISVNEKTHRVTFRLIFSDINGLEMVSEWFEVAVKDVTPPTIEDITGSPPRSNMDYDMKFRIGDNREVEGVLITMIFDDTTHLESEYRVKKFGPFDEIFEVSIPFPETSYVMAYNATIWDKEGNENYLEAELEVMDSVLPVILDMTSESPVTDSPFHLFFSVSDNEEVVNGFFHYRFDNGTGNNDTGIPHSFRIDMIPEYPNFLHYKAGVMDSDGNWGVIEKVQEILDGTPPIIELHADTPYTSRILMVNFTAVDNRDIWETKVSYSINGDSARLPAYFAGEYFEIDVPEDSITITIYGSASDSKRNQNETSISMEVLDDTPPSIKCRRTTMAPDGTIIISLKCSDIRELENVWAIVTDQNGEIHNFSEVKMDGDVQSLEFSKKGLGNKISFRIYAVDGSGNVAVSDNMSFTIKEEQDSNTSIFIWIFLIIIFLILALVAATGAVIVIRSRRQTEGPTHENMMKLKEVFNHFRMGTNKSDMDCYAILNVPRNATHDEIIKSYRELALIHHPDRIGTVGWSSDIEMKSINCAKTILLDPEKRAILDQYLGPP